MACSSCKQKKKEDYQKFNEQLKTYDKIAILVGIIFISLAIYGLYNLIHKFI